MVFARPDIALLHPPSVCDFRQMTIVPSPISDLIPSTPVFEMYPIGFTYLGEYLERNGINTRIVNIAQRMLESRKFDVARFLSRLEPSAFGIDLHWLTHAQGALELARLVKELHPQIPVIMGGYSATFFHRELAAYPQVDYVLRGDSTEEPQGSARSPPRRPSSQPRVPGKQLQVHDTFGAQVRGLEELARLLELVAIPRHHGPYLPWMHSRLCVLRRFPWSHVLFLRQG